METLGMALIIFVMAFLCESMVEYFVGTPLEVWFGNSGRLALRYVAAAVGIVMAYNWSVDFFADYLGLAEQIPHSGEIATGLVIGRGANFVHDLFTRVITGAPAGRTFRMIE